jgi:ubiquinone biosynthesis protein COQ4
MSALDSLASDDSPGSDLFALPLRKRLPVAARALRRLAKDPYDTQRVFEFGANINVGAIRRGMAVFYASAAGQRLYREQRAIDTQHLELDALALLPEGTLGREYVRFLADRGLSPDIFQSPANVSDPRAAFVMKRIRQTHDLWHLLTNHATTPEGEVALQAFTYGQLGVPSSLVIALLGTLRSMVRHPGLPVAVVRAWRAGRRATPLATFPWEDHWAMPLPALRRHLGIVAVP